MAVVLVSSRSSLTAATVTVWAVFQLAGVKVRVAGSAPESRSCPEGELARDTVTVVPRPRLKGWVARATLMVALVPPSVTDRVVGVMESPRTSLSTVVTATGWTVRPL